MLNEYYPFESIICHVNRYERKNVTPNDFGNYGFHHKQMAESVCTQTAKSRRIRTCLTVFTAGCISKYKAYICTNKNDTLNNTVRKSYVKRILPF